MFNYNNIVERRVATKHKLCPSLWEDGGLIESIKKKLLKIANDFFDDLDTDAEIVDVQLTGSIANYNYTAYSDIDIHIIIDFTEIDKNISLVKQAIDGQRFIWNLRHNIIIKDHDVELYVQDKSEAHVSSGVYSLLKNKWIVEPKKIKPTTETSDVEAKYDSYVDDLNRLEKLSKMKLYPDECEEYYDCIKELKSKIMKARKEGLAQNGEYSVENLVFKKLRNSGKIEKIINLTAKFYDMIYSQD